MKVKFVPQDLEVEILQGQTVMDVAHKNGVVIRSTCNGMPSCAECRVRVTEGDYNCNPPSRKELNLIGTGYYIDQRRLSCQLLCFGDVTIDTAEQIEKSAEGPVTKKFLTKVHKATAQESYSLGGVLIEQDGKLLQELKNDVSQDVQPSESSAGLSMREGRAPKPGGGGQRSGGGARSSGDRNSGRGGGGNSGSGRGNQPRREGQNQQGPRPSGQGPRPSGQAPRPSSQGPRPSNGPPREAGAQSATGQNVSAGDGSNGQSSAQGQPGQGQGKRRGRRGGRGRR